MKCKIVWWRNRRPWNISVCIFRMKVTKLEHSQLKLTFDVTKEEFEKAIDKAFETKNKEVTIKGFRKGTAPRSIFEKTYGVESLFADALDVIFNDKVQEAVADKELVEKFVGKFEPVVEEGFARGKDFQVSLVIDTYPEVVLPAYKGIEVAKKNLTVSEDDVKKAIDALAKKDAQMVAKEEQVIAKGDYAVFDFVGSVDGVEFPGGKADNYELQIGSGQFIPGFEDQMIGMKAEETKDINVTFPENYGQADLAGKAAVFKVTVHEIKVEKFPEFTDEYVKGLNINGASTLDELKANKKAELEAAKVQAEKDRQFDYIVNEVIEAASVDMPKSMIQERVNQFKAQYEQQAKMYNIPFEKFVELMGATIEQFNDQAQKQAEKQALFNVVASKIIEVEKLAPAKEAIEAKAEEEAKKNGKTKEANLQENFARYYSDLAYKALVDFLLTNAKEVDGEPAKLAKAEGTAEEKPAKKPAAKKTTKKAEDAEEAPKAEKKPAAKKTTTKKTAAKKDAE